MRKKFLKVIFGLLLAIISPMAMLFVGCAVYVISQLVQGIPISQSILDFKQFLTVHWTFLSMFGNFGVVAAMIGLLWKQRYRLRKAVFAKIKAK